MEQEIMQCVEKHMILDLFSPPNFKIAVMR